MSDKARLLLDTAIRLFSERGFWDTPTALIAKEAGVANGTLFNYFGSKTALIEGVYLSLKQDWADHIDAAEITGDTLPERLQECWKRSIEWPVANPDRYILLEQLKQSEDISRGTSMGGANMFAAAMALFAEAGQAGLIRSLPTDLIQATAFGQICATVQHITQSDNPDISAISATSFDMFWRGIAVNPTGVAA
jgi:AcrR family transcriptional regulator